MSLWLFLMKNPARCAGRRVFNPMSTMRVEPRIESHASALQQQIRFATKKAGGSTKNGRDSIGRRLGVKIYPNMTAKAGAIIIRQRGTKFYPGDNVGMGKDHTLFAKFHGIVRMTDLMKSGKRKRKVVHVDTFDAADCLNDSDQVELQKV